jgi:hypothetical protein
MNYNSMNSPFLSKSDRLLLGNPNIASILPKTVFIKDLRLDEFPPGGDARRVSRPVGRFGPVFRNEKHRPSFLTHTEAKQLASSSPKNEKTPPKGGAFFET